MFELHRGKKTGHDVDLLISHPTQGAERGILERLISRLSERGLTVYGNWEKGSSGEDELTSDASGKGGYLKSTLDHFEKWIGILRVDDHLKFDPEFFGHLGNDAANSCSSSSEPFATHLKTDKGIKYSVLHFTVL